MKTTFVLAILFLLSALMRAAEPAAVQAALDAIEHNEPEMISEEIRVCEIAAPPFHEQERAAELKRLFERLDLSDVHIDTAGNVIGTRAGERPRPNVVLAAHLDTVFPPGTAVKVTREGSILKGPGIGDDCRGLAVMLGLIERGPCEDSRNHYLCGRRGRRGAG
jgi:acetylornithine deacetylase/succinyl-diaminopimelate desuccinylase-like protein